MKFFFTMIVACCLCACSTTHNLIDPNPSAAEYNIRLGLGYLAEGQVPRAREKLLRALSQAPNMPEVQLAMGYFLLQINQLNQAGDYYQRALRLSPDSPEVQNNFGVYLCRAGQVRLAIKYFLRAATNSRYLHPDSAYENAGLCALKIPDKSQAKQFFEQALKFNPTRKQSLLEIARLKRYYRGHE